MTFTPLPIAGCWHAGLDPFLDARGEVIKPFQESAWAHALGGETIREILYTRSHRHALRGLHLQLPPMASGKLVTCVQGEVLDVMVDLRVGSPTYRQVHRTPLSQSRAEAIYVAPGIARGYLVLSDAAVVLQGITREYAPHLEVGIHWRSLAIDWPVSEPMVSTRDAALPALADFNSPLRYAD
jgi:dTDP-4-dehydrorhamnose 3,5-epimerase